MNRFVSTIRVSIVDTTDLNRNISIQFVKDNDRDMLDEIVDENHEQVDLIVDN